LKKYDFCDTFVILIVKQAMKRDKNLKITTKTHELLKKYCEQNGLKMFSFVEKLIRDSCTPKKDLYGEN
jgi:hypothetical protein